jgi:hypothetical protein
LLKNKLDNKKKKNKLKKNKILIKNNNRKVSLRLKHKILKMRKVEITNLFKSNKQRKIRRIRRRRVANEKT